MLDLTKLGFSGKKEKPISFKRKTKFRPIVGVADPEIVVSMKSFIKMQCYIDAVSYEIGWLGPVSREENIFRIEDVYLFEQNVTSFHNNIISKALAEFGEKLLRGGPKHLELFNKIRLWGHSHVDMDVLPSPEDDRQMEDLSREDVPYFIRGIFNKLGDVRFDIFFYEKNLKALDVSWRVEPVISKKVRERIEKEVYQKVTFWQEF